MADRGRREWFDVGSAMNESDGLCAMAGDEVVDDVIERDRRGDEPFNLLRISCSYADKS